MHSYTHTSLCISTAPTRTATRSDAKSDVRRHQSLDSRSRTSGSVCLCRGSSPHRLQPLRYRSHTECITRPCHCPRRGPRGVRALVRAPLPPPRVGVPSSCAWRPRATCAGHAHGAGGGWPCVRRGSPAPSAGWWARTPRGQGAGRRTRTRPSRRQPWRCGSPVSGMKPW